MKQSPEQLDLARRAWLAGLSQKHAIEPSAPTAFALAQGEWRCGEYDEAIGHFVEARDRAPEVAEVHLSLLRSASMLGLRELESAALGQALQWHPDDLLIALHAALLRVPGDLAAARALLLPHRADPLCGQFYEALCAIESGQVPTLDSSADPRQDARWDSLSWVLRHGADIGVHIGLPASVLLRGINAAPDRGLTVECGVYFGRSLRLIAERTAGAVHGFDSFEGLPEAWNEHEGIGSYSTAGRLPRVASNVRLHAGWFEDTLPPFLDAHPDPIRLLHVDCDLYSSTRTVLAAVNERLVPGSIIVFDDLLGYPGYEQHELRAFKEFAASAKIDWTPVAACLLGREVAICITSR